MSDAEDLKFLALLVHRGHVDRARAESILRQVQSAPKSGGSVLDLAVAQGLFTRERLDFLRRSEGEDVPEIPGFDLLAIAGRGGTAVVTRVREKKSGRELAVKVLRREFDADAKIVAAFQREAGLLLHLRHENVVAGEKVGRFQGRLIFLMEYVPGASLQDLLKEGKRFSEEQGLFIVLQVARALQYLAEQGVVHRDIKPANVLLTSDNRVKLIDLGFAASVGDGTSAPSAAESTTVGTVAYISPEQARGQTDLDVRSDIYSLGATLYQLVVGELPFAGGDNQEVLAAQILASLNSEVLKSRAISPHFHYFLEKMMAKERDVRYQSPAELIANIEEVMRGKKSADFATASQSGDQLFERPFDAQPPPDRGPENGPAPGSFRRRRRG